MNNDPFYYKALSGQECLTPDTNCQLPQDLRKAMPNCYSILSFLPPFVLFPSFIPCFSYKKKASGWVSQ